ncbi:hypothetical protein BHM03_00003853 [Ensete ventricosum]|nr:hypothetical protein BHM03_00003853 [Ensete ventricosum]
MYNDGSRKAVVTGSKNYVDGVQNVDTTTFAALGQGFIAKSMVFSNKARPEKHQVVAFRVQSNMSAFFNYKMDAVVWSVSQHSTQELHGWHKAG